MNARLLERIADVSFLILLSFVVLWRGGKGIEATWLLVAVGAVLLSVSAWKDRQRKDGADVPTALWITGIAFFLWSVCSLLVSLTPNYGLDEILRDGLFLLLTFWGARTFGGEGNALLRRAVHAIVFLTFIACAIGFAVYVFQPVSRFVGSFFYYRFSTDYWPNAWAEFLLLSWPLLLFWVRRADGRGRTFREGVLGWVLGCFLLSYSRGAAIAFAGQLVLLGFLAWRRGEWKMRRIGRALAVVCAATVITFVGANALRARFHSVESVAAKVTFSASEGSSSFTERVQFFRQALTLASMRPVWGWGPYSFRFVQPRLQTEVLQTSDHPHNVFLKLAVERGWVAAFLFTAFLALILIPAFGSLQRKEERESDDLRLLLFLGACGVLAHNLIDYNLQFVGIALPLALALGAVAPLGPVARRARRVRRMIEVVLAIALLLAAAAEFPFLVTSSLGRRAEAAGEIDAALAWYARSGWDMFPRDLALSRASLLLKKQLLFDAERMLLGYTRTNAEDARGWKLLGETEMQLFHAPEAVRDFRQAFLLSRFNDIGIARDELIALATSGDRAGVDGVRGDMEALLQAFGAAIQKNTHFIALSSNVEQFADLAKTAASLYPQDAAALRTLNDEVQSHARAVREEYSTRRAGMLW